MRADRSIADRANEVVADLAERLADPERVAAVAAEPSTVDSSQGKPPHPAWQPAQLNGGGGVALLHAELGRRHLAHDHLAAAVAAARGTAGPGLFHGLAGLAFAARMNASQPGDYARAIRRLDAGIAGGTAGLVEVLHARRAAGRPLPTVSIFDLISGLCGIGAYYLAAPAPDRLRPVLSALITLTHPATADGRVVPGWWVAQSLNGDPHEGPGGGHLNLGVAHGVGGPLALLSLAWLAGIRVGGHQDAIDSMAGVLLGRSTLVDGTHRWPSHITLADELRGVVTRTNNRSAWCYGTPGVARSLLLAACARDRADWRATALAALRRELSLPDLTAHIRADPSLCHGWAGLLLLATTTATDCADEELWQATHHLAAHVLEHYDPRAPFGYRHPTNTSGDHPPATNRPGLLDGSAGIALALSAYASSEPPRTRWTTAMLVA